MSGKTAALVIAVIMLAIGLGGVLYLKSNIRSVTDATAPLFVGETPAENPATPKTPIHEIQFSKSIALREKAMSVDGGDFMPIACSAGSTEPAIFGYIQLNEQQRADLTCAEEYMGGIGLTFIDPNGKQKVIKLVSSDGDAGEAWESRTWILKDNGLKIRTLTLTSSNDTETLAILACHADKSFQAWDNTIKDFLPATETTEFSFSNFTPPIGVAKECLNPDGTWKGL